MHPHFYRVTGLNPQIVHFVNLALVTDVHFSGDATVLHMAAPGDGDDPHRMFLSESEADRLLAYLESVAVNGEKPAPPDTGHVVKPERDVERDHRLNITMGGVPQASYALTADEYDAMNRGESITLPDPIKDESASHAWPFTAPPRQRTRDDIEELKAQWMEDPCYDLHAVEGFEAHAEELRYFQELAEGQWAKDSAHRIQAQANKLHCSPAMIDHLESVERSTNVLFQRLDERADDLAARVADLERTAKRRKDR